MDIQRKIYNPTVFIFADSTTHSDFVNHCGDLPIGAFCVDYNIPDLQNLQSHILENKDNLDIKRIILIVVAQDSFQNIRHIFEKNFAIVHLSLFLIGETNKLQNNGYNIVWLLSNKNENGVINSENKNNNLNIIKTIGFLQSYMPNNNFENALRLKNKPFATAGLASLQKPTKEIELCTFNRTLSRALEIPPKNIILNFEDKINELLNQPITAEKMLNHLESIIENKNRNLKNMTVKEAENSLYGDRVQLFFNANYNKEPKIVDIICRLANYAKEHLRTNGTINSPITDFDKLKNSINSINSEMNALYAERFSSNPITRLKNFKNTLSKIYVLKSQLLRLEYFFGIMDKLQNETNKILKDYQEFIDKIKISKAVPQNIAKYYEPIIDEILDSLNNLKPAYNFWGVGDFAEYITSFAKKHVLNNPKLNLSLEDDIKARELDFKNLIKDLDKNASLALYLNRYDDLVYERYYLGDLDGVCMQAAKEYNKNNIKRIDENVYYMQDMQYDNCFTLLKIAGGFDENNLTL